MTVPDKAAERSTLILQLGRLLAPIDELAEKPIPPTSTEYQVAAATFRHDLAQWSREVSRFITIGGVRFEHENNDILDKAYVLAQALVRQARDATNSPEDKQRQLRAQLAECKERTVAAIDRLPISWAPRLLEEQTPFSTYLKIHDAIGSAKRRLHYFDRYLDSDFYHLYLRDINRSLEVRLVTTRGNAVYGVTNVRALSKLVAQEFTNYQLLECDPSDVHDRNLRIDDLIFFLGPSIAQAGRYPTNFSPGDSTTNGHHVLDTILARGTLIT